MQAIFTLQGSRRGVFVLLAVASALSCWSDPVSSVAAPPDLVIDPTDTLRLVTTTEWIESDPTRRRQGRYTYGEQDRLSRFEISSNLANPGGPLVTTHVLETTYANGDREKTSTYSVSTSGNVLLSEETFQYTNGRLTGTVVREPGNQSTTGASFVYDRYGRLTEEREDAAITRYAYGASRNPRQVQFTDVDGATTLDFQYDTGRNPFGRFPIRTFHARLLRLCADLTVVGNCTRTTTSFRGQPVSQAATSVTYGAGGYPSQYRTVLLQSAAPPMTIITELTYERRSAP